MGAPTAAVADDARTDGLAGVPDDAVSGDVCFRCGYALHGIADDQPCPECGLLAERSRRATDELHDTRPGWLRRLSLGTMLLLASVGAAVAAPAVMAFVQERWGNWTFFTPGGFMGPSPRWGHVSWLGFDAAALLLLAGVWLLTGPEGYAPADRADRWQRRRLRAAALMPLLAVLLYHASVEVSTHLPFTRWVNLASVREPTLAELFLRHVETATALIVTLGCVPLPLLLFRRFRGLARRARSAHLAEHCTIVGIGASAALLFAAGWYVFAENAADWLGPYWMSRSTVAITVMAVLATAGLLFVLWSLYLAVRFAVAFGVAAYRLRATWRRADRSVLSAN